jgi:hypothetical protein
VNSVETRSIVRTGGDATFLCKTNRLWFLCVWKGLAGLAITKTQGQAGGDYIEAPDSHISLTGSGTSCQVTINRTMSGDEGQYSCVLADKEDVQTSVTRNISLDVGVGATVRWMQGYSIQYAEGDKVDLECKSEGGHLPPSLVIRSNGNNALEIYKNCFPFFFLASLLFRNYLQFLMELLYREVFPYLVLTIRITQWLLAMLNSGTYG